jgi:hypothetical protein
MRYWDFIARFCVVTETYHVSSARHPSLCNNANMMLKFINYITSRKTRKVFWENITGCFIAIIVLILLPIIFPLAIIDLNIRDRQKKASADKFKCIECSMILGNLGIQLAETKFLEYVNQLHEENPGWRFRIVMNIHAICSNCQVKYTYLEKEQTFERCTYDNRY